MSETGLSDFRKGKVLLRSLLGFILLYFGIKMYNEIPRLNELNSENGKFISFSRGVKFDQNMNLLLADKLHFLKSDSIMDSLIFTTLTKVAPLHQKLSENDKIKIWYPKETLQEERGEKMQQFEINNKVIIPYSPNRVIPIVMICFGSVIIILFGFLVRDLLKPKNI